MNVRKLVSGALIFFGMMFLVFGFKEYNSINSDVSRLLTGSATNKSIWFLIIGSVASIAGIFGYTRK